MFNVEVPLSDDPGKDDVAVHKALLERVAKTLRLPERDKEALLADVLAAAAAAGEEEGEEGEEEEVEEEAEKSLFRASVARKAFDGRWRKFGQPQFVYTVDVALPPEVGQRLRLRPQEGRLEPVPRDAPDDIHVIPAESDAAPGQRRKRVVVVGAGPAGLFAALELAEAGLAPIIIERGQPVERRGRDIGALFNRKVLNRESNLCYGEGGAGTWSDGKLTTRIGKNSGQVRSVLRTLVEHGAPPRILVDGKPHLGTDRLVRILQRVRAHLLQLGCEFRFGSRVDDLVIEQPSNAAADAKPWGPRGKVTGVVVVSQGADGKDGATETLPADVVCLAVGHSARRLYERLIHHGVNVECKPIAVGFRVEHPQELINRIQFGQFGDLCSRGAGPVPVADYRLATQVEVEAAKEEGGGVGLAFETERSCYSFCMCPGGQIVPTSVNPDELCINGMSFSKRQSKWANSALVVNVTPDDLERLYPGQGPLRGVLFQEEMERKAAKLGGGNLVAPVQRLSDFIAGTAPSPTDAPLPSSSYRLGVRAAPCHDIYPPFITDALRKALAVFDREMPGFICPDALLHGVETRTSAPVQITRGTDSLECTTLLGLYPAGEGAGYAGGIVSAAVDGLKVGRIVVEAVAADPWVAAGGRVEAAGTVTEGDKVFNPATKRWVSASGTLGKRLLKEQSAAAASN